MISDARIQELLDTEAIREVVARYFLAVGRRDWQAVEDCFASDASVDYEFDVEQTLKAQLVLLQAGMARFRSSTLMGSNCIVRLDGQKASSQTMALTAHEAPADSEDRTRLSTVRYDDEWVRTDHPGWLISKRRITTLWRAWLDPRRDDKVGDHRNAAEWRKP